MKEWCQNGVPDMWLPDYQLDTEHQLRYWAWPDFIEENKTDFNKIWSQILGREDNIRCITRKPIIHCIISEGSLWSVFISTWGFFETSTIHRARRQLPSKCADWSVSWVIGEPLGQVLLWYDRNKPLWWQTAVRQVYTSFGKWFPKRNYFQIWQLASHVSESLFRWELLL